MTSPFENFEDLILLSPSEMKRELCELMISISQGIDWYNSVRNWDFFSLARGAVGLNNLMKISLVLALFFTGPTTFSLASGPGPAAKVAHWYKVLVVGKDGKFYDMIEVSALWSMWLIIGCGL